MRLRKLMTRLFVGKHLLTLGVLVTLLVLVALPVLAVVVTPETEETVNTGRLLAAWTAIVGFFTPVVVNLIKKVGDARQLWTTRTKQWVALLVAAVVGVVETALVSGGELLDAGVSAATPLWQLALANVGGVWVVAQVAYANFWKKAKEVVDPPEARMYDENYNPGEPGYRGV